MNGISGIVVNGRGKFPKFLARQKMSHFMEDRWGKIK